MRAREAVLMAAVTGAVAVARAKTAPRAKKAPKTKQPTAQVPVQRATRIEALGLGVEDLEVAAHDAQDARLVQALDWTVG